MNETKDFQHKLGKAVVQRVHNHQLRLRQKINLLSLFYGQTMSKSDAAITDAVSGLTIVEVAGPSGGNQPNKHPHSILSDETINALDTRPQPGKNTP